MSTVRFADTLERWRLGAFARRDELAWPAKLGLALFMAALTGLAAQLRIPIPGTPVPVTGQVFAVLLAGVMLGGAWGGTSQLIYVGFGALGLSWFTGATGTAGYFLGFIPAAILIGVVSERFVAARRFGPQLALMTLGVAVIYLFGALVFAIQMRTDFAATLSMAVLPFVPFDLAKVVAAAAVAAAVLPKK